MAHAAEVIADSMSPDGVRLTTMKVVLPRIVLAEFNTHRMFSRNSASSRAIPVEKMLKRVQEGPYIPSTWGKNQKGMQAGEGLSVPCSIFAEEHWLEARDQAVIQAKKLLHLGVHKQLTNRLLEPFMWHEIIVTATEWANFAHLRSHPAAHPDIKIASDLMTEAYTASNPKNLRYGEWHTPYFDQDPLSEDTLALVALGLPESSVAMRKISAARCARVSYLTHEGRRDLTKDLELYERLVGPGHMSPLEHVARPAEEPDEDLPGCLAWPRDAHGYVPPDLQWHGNFNGWVQLRKTIPGEQDILGAGTTSQ